MNVNNQPTFALPRNFTFLSIPILFIHPKLCSIRFLFRWLIW